VTQETQVRPPSDAPERPPAENRREGRPSDPPTWQLLVVGLPWAVSLRLAAAARRALRWSRRRGGAGARTMRQVGGPQAVAAWRWLLHADRVVAWGGLSLDRRVLDSTAYALSRWRTGAPLLAATGAWSLRRRLPSWRARAGTLLQSDLGPLARAARVTGGLLRRRWLAALAVMVLGLPLLAWALSGPALRLGAEVLAGKVEDEGLQPLEARSAVLAPDGRVLTELPGGPDRDLATLDQVPDVLEDMVVAVEDDRFWEHGGWDGEGMLRAATRNVRSGGVREGGSTISQQLAKLNFVGTDRTVQRKVEELLYAVALEERYDKERLLQRYLNQVYLGSGAHGVAAAAFEYFGVPVTELSPDQAALLAGLVRSPGSLDPRRHPEEARQRRDLVLRIAGAKGILEDDEVEELQRRPLELAPPQPDVTDPLLVEAVRRELLAEPALGDTVEDRAELLATGGLRIETSIDPRLQDAAVRAVQSGVDAWPGLGGALAAVATDGRVLALASVNPPGTERFDLAAQGRRQPGSTFKPLAAMAALEAGLDPEQRFVGDGPVRIEHAPGQEWIVDNYAESDHGTIDLREALVSSVNTAFAQIGVATGIDRLVDVTGRLGIDVEAALGAPDQRGPSVALGALSRGVSPLEMASAYTVLASGGTHVDATVVERVVDRDGRALLRRTHEPEPAVEPAVVGEVRDILQEVVQDGTGRAAQLPGWEPAGKTGTSQQNADAWFVGTLPSLTAATWLGHPNGSQPVPDLTGGGAAAPMWQAFMAEALDGVPPVLFGEATDELEVPDDPLEVPDAEPAPEEDDEDS